MIRTQTNVYQAAVVRPIFKYGYFIGRSFLAATVLITLLAAFSQAPTKKIFVIISPVPYQMFQRDWVSNTANIPITVDAVGFGDSISVTANLQDDNWIPVQLNRVQQGCDATNKTISSTWRSVEPCTRYQGLLSGVLPGQGTLSLRIADWGARLAIPNVEASVNFVGVGDVILLAGQSNIVGIADNFQHYQSNHFIATMYSRTGQWLELDDHVMTDQRPVGDGSVIKGSPWPILGTMITQYTGDPVAFIPTGVGSQPISQWAVNGRLYKFTVQQARLSGTQPVIMLWHQGESDALTKMSTSDYQAALNSLAQRFNTDLHIRMMITNLEYMLRPGITDVDVEHIRQAITNVWASNPLVYQGPTLKDIPLVFQPHFTTDAEVTELAQRWFDKLVSIGLPAHS